MSDPPSPPLDVITDRDAAPADLGPLVELLLEELARREGEPPPDNVNM
jgi:hypothetical protein